MLIGPKRVAASVGSETGQIGMRQLAPMHMEAPHLGAAMQLRKNLSGVQETMRVERAFEPLLLLQIRLAEHAAHEIALLDADTVLAGQYAADLHAELQNVGAEGLGAFELAGLIGVVEDQRMEVAIARMEDIRHAKRI